MIPRKRIHAHNARVFAANRGAPLVPSQTGEALRTVYKANSGYVHAASSHVMEMYGGDPPRFHMSGMLGTPLDQAHRDNFWNYVCRSLYAACLVAMAFGNDRLWAETRRYAKAFEQSRRNRED